MKYENKTTGLQTTGLQTKSLKVSGQWSMVMWSVVMFLLAAASWSQTPRSSVVPRRLVFVAWEAFNRPLKDPMGVWCDTEQKEILVADTGNHRIVIFDENGRAKGEFVHCGTRNGDAHPTNGEPRRLAVNSKGDIFIVDAVCDYVDVCDYRGRSLRRVYLREGTAQSPFPTTEGTAPGGTAQSPFPTAEGNGTIRAATVTERANGENVQPVAVTVDYQDNLYVASATQIFVFNARGEFQRVLGKGGKGAGQFTAITSLWVDTAGRIYVTDAQSLGVHILAPDGTVLVAFGEHDAGFTNFSLPIAIATDRRGTIWVADSLRHIVSAFERDGKDIKYLDYIGAFGTQPGQFAYPSGLSAAWNGRLVVVDRVGGRVQCFEM